MPNSYTTATSAGRANNNTSISVSVSVSVNTNISLIPASAYYDELLRIIPTAKKRLIIHAMILAWTPLLSEHVLPLIHDALRRGVNVSIVGDSYTQASLTYFGSYRFSRIPQEKWQHTLKANAGLQTCGANVAYVGQVLFYQPFKNRCHSKITIIDDTCYTFGGVNFSDDSFMTTDYMLKINNAQLADYLQQLVQKIAACLTTHALPNIRQALNNNTTLLFDGGEADSSIIYNTACELVAQATRVVYVSQFPPSGRLGKLLATKSCEAYFDRPSQGDFPFNLAFALDAWRYKGANLYKGNTFIHAKYILTEDQDGTKHVISGSNNFSWSGVHFGTKEIAIHSTDPALWDTFYAYTAQITA